MKQNFYIFLDIDEVLAGSDYITKITQAGQRLKATAKDGLTAELDPKCLAALNFFIDNLGKKYQVKLVISSSWRSDLQNTIKILEFCGLKYDSEITRTGLIDHVRGLEISDHLKNQPDNNNYVVIDDDLFDIEPYISPKKVIKTSLADPLSLKHVKKYLKLLNISTNLTKESNNIRVQ